MWCGVVWCVVVWCVVVWCGVVCCVVLCCVGASFAESSCIVLRRVDSGVECQTNRHTAGLMEARASSLPPLAPNRARRCSEVQITMGASPVGPSAQGSTSDVPSSTFENGELKLRGSPRGSPDASPPLCSVIGLGSSNGLNQSDVTDRSSRAFEEVCGSAGLGRGFYRGQDLWILPRKVWDCAWRLMGSE